MRNKRTLPLILCLLLAGATLAVYAPAATFDFVSYDDRPYVTENPQVLKGISIEGIVWAFTGLREVNWHPLTWLSHMLDVEIFGARAGGHHATSVALHLLNTLLLFLLLRTATGALWRSAFVAALFSLHPLHVESVVWIAERKDVLSATMGLLSMWAYVRYVREESAGAFNASLLFHALSLMSKPMLVTLPLVFLLLDHWPLDRVRWPGTSSAGDESRRRSPLQLVREKAPHLALSIGMCAITLLVQKNFGAMKASEAIPLLLRTENALVSYVRYLAKTIWPSGLTPLYPHPYIEGTGAVPWAGPQVFGAVAMLAVLCSLALFFRRRGWTVVGWLWFLGTLVPAIGLVQVGTQAMADRYTYVPLIGLFIIFAWTAVELAAFLAARGLPGRGLVVSICVGLVFLSALVSRNQLEYWRNSESLYTHALNVTPRNSIMLLGLAGTLGEAGQNRRAIELYRQALEIKPDYAAAHKALGDTLRRRGEIEAAMVHLQRAIDLEPGDAEARLVLGGLLERRNQSDRAIAQYRAALVPGVWLVDAHTRLGIALMGSGRPKEAADQFRRALEIEPNSAKIHHWLSQAERRIEQSGAES